MPSSPEVQICHPLEEVLVAHTWHSPRFVRLSLRNLAIGVMLALALMLAPGLAFFLAFAPAIAFVLTLAPALAFALTLVPALAYAHPGHGDTDPAGFLHYLIEPRHWAVPGLVLVCVGLWFHLRKRRDDSRISRS
jgi:hypothetical protein